MSPKKFVLIGKVQLFLITKLVLSVEGGLELFFFLYSIVFVKFGLLYGKRVFGGWVDMYKKGDVGWKWFSIFYRCLTFVC